MELLIELRFPERPLSTKCLKIIPKPSTAIATIHNEQNTIIRLVL
jgi:hypothetical protein